MTMNGMNGPKNGLQIKWTGREKKKHQREQRDTQLTNLKLKTSEKNQPTRLNNLFKSQKKIYSTALTGRSVHTKPSVACFKLAYPDSCTIDTLDSMIVSFEDKLCRHDVHSAEIRKDRLTIVGKPDSLELDEVLEAN
ncbi:hypothetical protein P5673_009268 [Acropora cervicornis]|uniref:Uncharacterized protein n=1 Tax=Acropora cervicornis TaxID=6130 RepID=A0AAD9QSD9_ACRCE|nr:hypothetical protein P5673_009268 [Acropora cervicornis]